MLGAEQERWLDAAFADSRALWNVLAQEVMFVTIVEGSRESPRHFSDAWAGYPPARERLLASLVRERVANPIVLTGDIHSFWVNEVATASGRPVAVELVTSSIATSNSDKTSALPLNPQVRFHEGRHSGYLRCELGRERLRTDIVMVDDIRDPRSPRSIAASFEVRAGEPRARRL
jgi:alkaline phosphatase D